MELPTPSATSSGPALGLVPRAEDDPDVPLSDDELADQIVTWSGRLAAGEARLLDLVAEFDRREAWAGPGLLSCAHWLTWRVGLGPGAAREKVRVARALRELPLLHEALAEGRLSYSQARAASRVATSHDEQLWVDMAAHSTAGQLERLARGVRRARRAEEDAVDPEAAAYRMRATKRYDEDGTAVFTVRLPAEQAAVLDAALAQVQADLDRAVTVATAATVGHVPAAEDVSAETSGTRRTRPDDAPMSPARATLADALLAMAGSVLASHAVDSPSASRRARSALIAQVDPLTGWGRLRDGEVLPPSSLRTVVQTLPGRGGGPSWLRRLTSADLRRHDGGRRLRRPGLLLRELLGTVDGERCRFPGCTRHRRLHAHHVVPWEHGGPTDLDNLLLLCPRHHVLVHSEGFVLVLHPDRRLEVRTAGGVLVPHVPRLPWGLAEALDPTGRVSAETRTAPLADQRLDLGYAVSVLLQHAA